MHADRSIARRPLVDLPISLFLDRRNDYAKPMRPRRIQQQERESSVTCDQTESVLKYGRPYHAIEFRS